MPPPDPATFVVPTHGTFDLGWGSNGAEVWVETVETLREVDVDGCERAAIFRATVNLKTAPERWRSLKG